MLYFLLSAALIIIDQLVKAWVRGNVPLWQSVPFLPRVMDLTYVQNTGAAFSLLAGRDLTWLLALVSLGACVLLAALLASRRFGRPLAMLSLSLMLGGAAGNLIDRALFGFVTDMFKTTFIDFAVFNVADIGVTVGGVLFFVYLLFFEGREGPQSPEDVPPAETSEEPHDQP